MKTIWKFILSDNCTLEMPVGSKILSVQEQGEDIALWALVDTEAPRENRAFLVYGTGHPIKFHNIYFVGTVQLNGGSLVFHVFEVADKARQEELTRASRPRISHG